ncbi:MAG: oligosaccharide flippase family protein [Armatimonadota bacterium]
MAVNAPDTTVRREHNLAQGTIALVGVQSAFLIGGYFVHFYLGRKLGPADYGVFGVVMAFLTWMEVSLTGGFPNAIRKFGAEREELMSAIARSAIRGQFVFSTLIFIIALATAPWVAKLMHDPGLTGLIRLASIDIPIYAFYFCYTAILNGKRNYVKQSSAMLIYAIAKVGTMLFLVIIGFGVRGAIIGNILASIGGLATAAIAAGRLPKTITYPIKKLISYAGGTAVFSIGFTLLMSIDMFAVKALMRTPESTGFYTAAYMVARAPFYVLIGIPAATLPALSKAASNHDYGAVRLYVRQSLRLHMILLVPITAILSGTSSGIVELLYTNKYIPAVPALAVLAAGLMLFGFLYALYNILVAIGDIRTPLLGTTILIAIALALNIALIPRFGITGAAVASVSTAGAGLLASAVICAGRLGGLVAPLSAFRITVAGIMVYLAAGLLPARGLQLAGTYVVLFAVYALALTAMREITKEDISKIAAAVAPSIKNRRCGEGKTR